MNKDVKVCIKGLHENESESSDVGIEVAGQYYLKGNKHYICYEEISEEVEEITRSIIKISKDKVEVIKKGAGATHMEFIKDCKNSTYLSTIVGKILVGIDTKSLEIVEKEDEINVKIEYGLLMDNEKVSDCNVEIRIWS